MQQTHQDQLAHVMKGCLARTRDDVRSDGSRIEGSHKGWNSLQRSFASGLVLILALGHDFVLRRNCRISINNKPSLFALSTHGSHHIRLINHAARLSNTLVSKEKTDTGSVPLLPELQTVNSGEEFGLVSSDYATSFRGLIEIKEEVKDEYIPDYDASDVDALMRDLSIDPALLVVPENRPFETSSSSQPLLLSQPTAIVLPSTSSPSPVPFAIGSTQPCTTEPVRDSITPASNKRKNEEQPRAETNSAAPAAKKIRIAGADANTALGSSATTVSFNSGRVSYLLAYQYFSRLYRHTLWVRSRHLWFLQQQPSLPAAQTLTRQQAKSMFSIYQCLRISRNYRNPNDSSRSLPALMFDR